MMAGEIVGILLAAGAARRFGSDKLIHPLADGTPMALAAARNLGAACDRVVVVLRAADHPLARPMAQAGYDVVVCPAADAGMGHSLAAGVCAAHEAAAWVVTLADMPFIEPASHRAVVDALRAGASLAATQYQGRRGHPVGFSSQWRLALSALVGDQGGREILSTHRAHVVPCPVDDEGVLMDIDRPDDLRRTACRRPFTSGCLLHF